MPNFKKQIHYILSFKEWQKIQINGESIQSVDVVYLKESDLDSFRNEIDAIRSFFSSSTHIIVEQRVDFALEIKADGVLLSHFNEKEVSFKKDYPNLILIGNAHTMADCKNWELVAADYIIFEPLNESTKKGGILGSETVMHFIPKNEMYGWMILSLNVPVILGGVNKLETIKELFQNSGINGVVLKPHFYNYFTFKQVTDLAEDFNIK